MCNMEISYCCIASDHLVSLGLCVVFSSKYFNESWSHKIVICAQKVISWNLFKGLRRIILRKPHARLHSSLTGLESISDSHRLLHVYYRVHPLGPGNSQWHTDLHLYRPITKMAHQTLVEPKQELCKLISSTFQRQLLHSLLTENEL